MASSCVVFRLAKSIQEAAKAAMATEPEPESCLVRAARIAAHYWDDPAKWAASDPFGKGVRFVTLVHTTTAVEYLWKLRQGSERTV